MPFTEGYVLSSEPGLAEMNSPFREDRKDFVDSLVSWTASYQVSKRLLVECCSVMAVSVTQPSLKDLVRQHDVSVCIGAGR